MVPQQSLIVKADLQRHCKGDSKYELKPVTIIYTFNQVLSTLVPDVAAKI